MENNKQIVVNLPDFIDYEEVQRELIDSLKYEMRGVIRNMVRDIENNQIFKQLFREIIKEEINSFKLDTNMVEIIKNRLNKAIEEEKYQYNWVVDEAIKEYGHIFKEELFKNIEPKLIENSKNLDKYRVESVLAEIATERLKTEDYSKLIQDMLEANFGEYFIKKEDL